MFTILLTFSNLEACWNYYHDNAELLADHTNVAWLVCNHVQEETNAPGFSLRPRSRDDE